jgi:hypothetical protein
VAACPSVEQANDLSRTGVPPEFRFLEYRHAVRDDLESSASRRDQFDARLRKPLTKLSRQPDGSRFVISHRAIFDRDVHGPPARVMIAIET